MDKLLRYGDLQAALQTAMRAQRAETWTALPGEIESFNAAAQTCTVQLTVSAQVRADDGSVSSEALPVLVDCPAQFPSGGNSTLTFPVAKGDECLVVFASRCIDAWWQSGGVQEQAEVRMHSLSDGFALLGFRSQPRVLKNVSTTSAQLRSDDGSTYIDLNPTARTLKIVAPGGFEVVAPTQTYTATTSLEVDSPTSTFSGALTVEGAFTFLAGLIGSATSGAAAVITGTINFIGRLTANGKVIDDTHTHPNGEGGNTGEVN